ncbi:unnamed protein product [Blepharisma stoltei]|uniref:Uncharacterized protein n=1 Tax=Blepharisma stoltei TaxID=1481888 RepID=A0AAU9IFC6_9CILI|nr:unnamed protein product [Blepharisma stoltei]
MLTAHKALTKVPKKAPTIVKNGFVTADIVIVLNWDLSPHSAKNTSAMVFQNVPNHECWFSNKLSLISSFSVSTSYFVKASQK